MATFRKRFENELGHTISLHVDPKEIGDVLGILISISGPTSLAENHITLAEAQVMHELLGAVLDNVS